MFQPIEDGGAHEGRAGLQVQRGLQHAHGTLPAAAEPPRRRTGAIALDEAVGQERIGERQARRDIRWLQRHESTVVLARDVVRTVGIRAQCTQSEALHRVHRRAAVFGEHDRRLPSQVRLVRQRRGKRPRLRQPEMRHRIRRVACDHRAKRDLGTRPVAPPHLSDRALDRHLVHPRTQGRPARARQISGTEHRTDEQRHDGERSPRAAATSSHAGRPLVGGRCRSECGRHFGGRLKSFRRYALHRPRDGVTQIGRRLRSQHVHRGRWWSESSGDDCLRCRAGERGRAGRHLVQHAPQAVDVAPSVAFQFPTRLLRAHVRGGAEDEARLRRAHFGGFAEKPGDTEIDDVGVGVREEDVPRRHVSVQHAFPMRIGERLGYLRAEPDDVDDREWPLPQDAILECLAVDVCHHVERQLLVHARVVERNDVRVD